MANWIFVGQGSFETVFPEASACIITFNNGGGGGVGGMFKRIGVATYQEMFPPFGPARIASPKGLPAIIYIALGTGTYKSSDSGINWTLLPDAIGGNPTRIWCKDGDDNIYSHIGVVSAANPDNGSVWLNGLKIIDWPAHTITEQSFTGEGVLSDPRIFIHFGYPDQPFSPQLAWVDDDATLDLITNRDAGEHNSIPGFAIWPAYSHPELAFVAQDGLVNTGLLRYTVGSGYTEPADLDNHVIGCVRHSYGGHTMIAHQVDGAIYRSTDDGLTWTEVHAPDLSLICDGVPSLANDPVDSNNWFAVMTGDNFTNVAVSDDDGLTWSVEAGPAPGGFGDHCSSVVVTG